MYMYTKSCHNLAGSSIASARRVISKLATFADTVITVSSFFAYHSMKQ